MKKIILSFVLLFVVLFSNAQGIPSITLKDLEGNPVNMSALPNGKPIVFCFWATWCAPCKKELNNYTEYYNDWQEKYGITIYAISIDDQRSVARVAPYVGSVSWDYKVILDSNKQFAQAMGVNNVPHTFIVDGSGNIVWSHNNYSDGDEAELEHQLEQLTHK
jgi:cytochrome c biogenesis protein CcmG, thiol:disulfide interchange protein DsbE